MLREAIAATEGDHQILRCFVCQSGAHAGASCPLHQSEDAANAIMEDAATIMAAGAIVAGEGEAYVDRIILEMHFVTQELQRQNGRWRTQWAQERLLRPEHLREQDPVTSILQGILQQQQGNRSTYD